MKDLTISQEYFICAVNRKGQISGFSTERIVCLVAAGLLEMQLENCVSIDKKTVVVVAPLPEKCSHLRPLYDYINTAKPVKVEKILEDYTYSLTDSRLNALMDSLGRSLIDAGLAEAVKSGLISSRVSYVPTNEAINYVVDMVRSELLEDVEITADIACLAILLDSSGAIKTYFSDFERKQIKSKLKKLSQSETGNAVKETISYIQNLLAIMTVLIVSYN